MSEGAPWWKRLSKRSKRIGGKEEVLLHRRSCRGREVLRDTEEKITKLEPLEPPVSIEIISISMIKKKSQDEKKKCV